VARPSPIVGSWVQALADGTPRWQLKDKTVLNKPYNKEIQKSLDIVMDTYTPKMK
jgi:hypothetical protein